MSEVSMIGHLRLSQPSKAKTRVHTNFFGGNRQLLLQKVDPFFGLKL